VHLDAVEAGLMPAWNKCSVFVGEIADVAQSLLIELIFLRSYSSWGLLTGLLCFLHGQPTSARMLPYLVGCAKHFDFFQHHGEAIEDFAFLGILRGKLPIDDLSQLLEKHRVEGISLSKDVRELIILLGVLQPQSIHCIIQMLENAQERCEELRQCIRPLLDLPREEFDVVIDIPHEH
jgi:transposase